MASITKQSNGRKVVQFVCPDGRRRSLRIGKVSLTTAEQVAVRVERIIACRSLGLPLDVDVENWVRSLSNEMAERFAAVGLISPRIDSRLKKFLDSYIAGRADTKQSTISNMQTMMNRIVEHFGPDRQLNSIVHVDALDFLTWLKKERYADSTIARTLRRCREAFNMAKRRKLIFENPFDGVTHSDEPNPSRKKFIDRETINAVIEACPDLWWRLIVAFCRYAGFRCPTELQVMRWTDIDWHKSRMRIDSPKTGERWCPIFPELRPYLEEAFEAAPECAEFIFDSNITASTNLRTHFVRIINRAGIKQWPKLFNNLRSSCETELVEKFPIHVVAAWLGNSSAIASKHYLQIRDENFAAASSVNSKQCPVLIKG